MNAPPLPPASVLRPELRARLERLEHLERRERQSRYARWHVPAPVEREPEGWLLTYLDLITLLLVMLVVMLALSQLKSSQAAEQLALLSATPAEQAAPSPPPAGTVSDSTVPNKRDMPVTQSLPAGAQPMMQTAESPVSTSSADVPGAPADALAFAGSPAASGIFAMHAALPAVSADKAAVLADAPKAPDDGPEIPAGRPGMLPHLSAALGQDSATIATPWLAGSTASSAWAREATQSGFILPDSGVTLPPAGPLPDTAATPVVRAPDTDAAAPAALAPPVPEQAPAPARPSLEELGLSELGEGIDVIVNAESVSFRINNEILFSSGQASLTESGLDVLGRLAQVLARNDYRIAVQGHTDPVPIRNGRFGSNWELSTGRATSVLRHLETQGIASGRLRATGFADTRPIAPNDSPAGRAFNRRVELIMETPAKAAPVAPPLGATAATVQSSSASSSPSAAASATVLLR